MIVVDASLMIAWLLQEPEFASANDVFDSFEHETIAVPGHWSIEIASALWVNLRRGRISLEELLAVSDELATFDVMVDAPVAIGEIESLTRSALTGRLTVYDAAYVRLATRLNAPLATLDNDMRAAARRLNIHVVPA